MIFDLDVVFRSGMTSKSDLRGAIAAGVPVGVVAGHLTASQMFMALPRYLIQGGKVFIDSGAFTLFMTGVAMDWRNVMQRYAAVALAAGPSVKNLFIVAPDRVGDQVGTMTLLIEWAEALRVLIDEGCRVIVPIQCGRLPGQKMIEEVVQILGTRQFIAGIPSNRAAMPIEECRSLHHMTYHILGRVQTGQEQLDRIAALRDGSPLATITADANWLRSRISGICKLTDIEKSERWRPGRTGFMDAVDGPRALAVERALRMEKNWGEQVPGSNFHPFQETPASTL